MRKITVNPNEKFNKLTVIEMLGVNEDGFSVASCRCDCGNIATIRVSELRSGHKRSCGCSSWKERSKDRCGKIVGKSFGRLLVISLAGTDGRYRLCKCKCDCGKDVTVRIALMLRGEIQSCGCLQLEKAMNNLARAQAVWTTHGLSKTPTGQNWLAMMQRCFNPRSESFHRYGGMGIKPCLFLKSTPLNLVLTIGHRPSPEMSVDRIDTTKGYHCGMCEECLSNGWLLNIRWATAKEQASNRTNNRLVEIDGVTKQASKWCEELGLSKTSKKIYTYPA